MSPFRALVAVGVGLGAVAVLPGQAAASTVSLSPGTLHYTAAPGEQNRLVLADDGVINAFRVTDPGAAIVPGAGCQSVSATVVRCSGALIGDTRSYNIQLRDGDDAARVTSSYLGAASTLDGGTGRDALTGGRANDLVLAGDGADQLDGGPGPDRIFGAAGFDTVSYAGRALPVNVDLADGLANDGEATEHDFVAVDVEGVLGGLANDVLFGSDLANRLGGGPGSDVLLGRDGDDTLTGATGGDIVSGGLGTDTVSYASHVVGVSVRMDTLANDGAPGESDLVGSDNENVIGGSGNDALVGTSSANQLFGAAGNDTLTGGGASDLLSGGAGDDRHVGRDGVRDSLVCSTGFDTGTADALDVVAADCEAVVRG